MIEEIKHIAKENLSKIIALRQALHKNPELSFEEFETSKAVQEFLQKNNVPLEAGFVKTGVVLLGSIMSFHTKKDVSFITAVVYSLM